MNRTRSTSEPQARVGEPPSADLPEPASDAALFVEGPELSRRLVADLEAWCAALVEEIPEGAAGFGPRHPALTPAGRLALPAPAAARQPEAGLLDDTLHPEALVGRVCPAIERWRRWEARLTRGVVLDDLPEDAIARLPSPRSPGGPPPLAGRYVDAGALTAAERRWHEATVSVLAGRYGAGPLWRVLGYPFAHPYLTAEHAVRENVAIAVEHGGVDARGAALALATALRATAAVREWTVLLVLGADRGVEVEVAEGVSLTLAGERPVEVLLSAIGRALGPLGVLRVLYAHRKESAPWRAPGAWRHRFDRVVAWVAEVPTAVPAQHARHLLRVLTSRSPGAPGQLTDPSTPWFGAWVGVAPRIGAGPRFAALGDLRDVIRSPSAPVGRRDWHEPPLPRTIRDHVRSSGALTADAAAVARALRFERLGFGIGGGGAVAFRAVAAVGALRSSGLEPDVLTGVSGGAVASVLLGADGGEAVQRALADPRAFTRAALRFTLGDHAAVSGLVVRLAGRRDLGGTRVASYPVAVRILPTGEPVVVAGVCGHLGDAVEASGAHPLVFPPVRLGGAPFVDGGAVAHVPALFLPDLGADFVIGCNGFRLGYHASVEDRLGRGGLRDRLVHARIGLLLMAEQYLQAARRHAHAFLAPPPSPDLWRILENPSFHRLPAIASDWEPGHLQQQVDEARARYARFRGTLRRGARL